MRGEYALNPVPSPTTKRLSCVGIIGILALVLLLATLFFIGLFSKRIPIKLVEPINMSVLGGWWLVAGIRKFRARRTSGQRVSWYTQPSILLALAALLAVPLGVIYYATDGNFPNGDVILIASLIPSCLLFIAAAYFGIKRFTHPFED